MSSTPLRVLSLARANAATASASRVQYQVTFSEPVTGLSTANFSLKTSGLVGAGIASVVPTAGSPGTYTITVNPGTGVGSLELDLTNANSIVGVSGDHLPGGLFALPVVSSLSRDENFVAAAVVIADFNGDNRADFLISRSEFVNGATSSKTWPYGLVSTYSPSGMVIAIGQADGSLTKTTDRDYSIDPYAYLPSGTAIDLNGDGKTDVVSTLSIQGGFTIALGNGDGTLRASVSYDTYASISALAVADINHDGVQDIVVCNETSLRIEVFIGNGDGTFQSPNILNSGNNFARSIVVDDFNGDGRSDILAYNDLFINNGDGTFTDRFIPFASSTSWQVSDINHDGSLDIFCYYQQNFVANLNNGDGTFRTVETPALNVVSCQLAHLRSATQTDIVSLDTIGQLSFWLSQGDGTFIQAAAAPHLASYARSFSVADVNADGFADVYGTQYSGSFVMIGNGDGTFQSPLQFNLGPGKTFGPTSLADVNGDGFPDLVTLMDESTVGFSDNAQVAVMLGSAPPTPGPTYSVIANQIVFHNVSGTIASWQVGATGAASKQVVDQPSLDWSFAGVARLPNGNDLDVLQNSDGRVAVSALNGYSHALPASVVGYASPDWHFIGSGDAFRDGHFDLFWRNNDGRLIVWEMNPTGTAKQAESLVQSPSADWKFAGVGDFAGDGRTEFLWQNNDGRVAEWALLGTPGNPGISGAIVDAPSADWHVAAIGDANGDGKADIFYTNNNGDIALAEMNGFQHLIGNQMVGQVTTDWKIAGAADFNGDGKADLLFRNIDGGIALWTLDGANALSKQVVGSASTDWQMFV